MLMKKRNELSFYENRKRGSAIIMALLTMLLLVVLGLAVTLLSFNTIKMSSADNNNNKAYYAAESGVKSAIEQIKYEVSSYYNSMLTSSGSDYSTLYTNFFSNIRSNVGSHFTPPAITGVSTSTTFTLGTFDSATNTCPFIISTTATAADGGKYRVNGTLTIKRVDVSQGTGSLNVGDNALTAGGNLNLGNTNGINLSGGDAEVGSITRQNTWQLGISGGQLVINPAQTISNPLTYPSYSNPVITSPTLYITTNNYVLSTNQPAPVAITTADNINVSIKSCTIGTGTIYVKGNLTVEGGTYNADVYCDGDLIVKNCTFNGKAYCRGNLTITSVSFAGAVRCDGFIDMTNGSFTSTTLSGGGINIHAASSIGSLYSSGNISVSNASLTDGVVYSRTGITIGSMSARCVFFSGGNVTITSGTSISGAIIAKNNIGFDSDSNKWMTLSYSKSIVDSIVAKSSNSFFFTSSTPTLNQDVILGQDITPSGRVN